MGPKTKWQACVSDLRCLCSAFACAHDLCGCCYAVAQWNDEEAQKDCVKKNECSASFPIVPACTCSDIPPVVRACHCGHFPSA